MWFQAVSELKISRNVLGKAIWFNALAKLSHVQWWGRSRNCDGKAVRQLWPNPFKCKNTPLIKGMLFALCSGWAFVMVSSIGSVAPWGPGLNYWAHSFPSHCVRTTTTIALDPCTTMSEDQLKHLWNEKSITWNFSRLRFIWAEKERAISTSSQLHRFDWAIITYASQFHVSLLSHCHNAMKHGPLICLVLHH